MAASGQGEDFDDSWTVFNDFALAKEGAQDGAGGPRSADAADGMLGQRAVQTATAVLGDSIAENGHF